MIAAVIPARLGSRGVPKKNIKELAGKPLIYWTVKAAVDSEVDKVYVTSESGLVSEALWPHLTEQEKGKVYFVKRPSELSQDHVQVDEVVLYTLRQIQYLGVNPQAIVVLQPTSPFRGSPDINRALITYHYLKGESSIVGVCKAENTTDGKYYWRGGVESGLTPLGHDPQIRRGRQWASIKNLNGFARAWDILQENGAVYVVPVQKLEDYKTFRAPPFAPVFMDSHLEIDSCDDWQQAESMAGLLHDN